LRPKQLVAFDASSKTDIVVATNGSKVDLDEVSAITLTLADGRKLSGSVDRLAVNGRSMTWQPPETPVEGRRS
jgi:ABC-type uncharacterized transport system YnjBCD substrate-binding protein